MASSLTHACTSTFRRSAPELWLANDFLNLVSQKHIAWSRHQVVSNTGVLPLVQARHGPGQGNLGFQTGCGNKLRRCRLALGHDLLCNAQAILVHELHTHACALLVGSLPVSCCGCQKTFWAHGCKGYECIRCGALGSRAGTSPLARTALTWHGAVRRLQLLPEPHRPLL